MGSQIPRIHDMICVPNIDSKIWDPESMILDIVAKISQRQPVRLNLNGEGPCAESLGLYRILDDICERFAYARDKITILTCNQVEHHAEYDIKISPPLYIDTTQNFASSVQDYFTKSFQQDFRHFGIFIGRSNWIRLWLSSKMHERYALNTVMTYHWKPNDQYHSQHIGLDDMLKWNADATDVRCASKFLAQCPLVVTEEISSPIYCPEHLNICKIYDRFFVEMVCETYYSGSSFYPTEKIWRPLLMKTPFIVHGSVDYLKNLRRLGFRTFDNWWNEEYDDYGHDLRVGKILDLLQHLQDMSIDDLASMYVDMFPTLEHNHRVFMNLHTSDFAKTFGYA